MPTALRDCSTNTPVSYTDVRYAHFRWCAAPSRYPWSEAATTNEFRVCVEPVSLRHADVSVHPGTNTTNVNGESASSAAFNAVAMASYASDMTSDTNGGLTWKLPRLILSAQCRKKSPHEPNAPSTSGKALWYRPWNALSGDAKHSTCAPTVRRRSSKTSGPTLAWKPYPWMLLYRRSSAKSRAWKTTYDLGSLDASSFSESTTFAAAFTKALSSSSNLARLSSSSSSESSESSDESPPGESPPGESPPSGGAGRPGSDAGVDRRYIAANFPYARLESTAKCLPRVDLSSTDRARKPTATRIKPPRRFSPAVSPSESTSSSSSSSSSDASESSPESSSPPRDDSSVHGCWHEASTAWDRRHSRAYLPAASASCDATAFADDDDTPARVRSSTSASNAAAPPSVSPFGITGSMEDEASSACFAAKRHRSNA